MKMLLLYYKNEYTITNEDMNIEYDMFIEAGIKPVFYKTDAEVEQVIPVLLEKMKKAQSLNELNKFADECVFWSRILGRDTTEILREYRERLQDMLRCVVSQGHEEELSYNIDLWHLSTEEVKQVYIEEKDEIRRWMIKSYIDYLAETTKGKKAYEYSYKLREYWNNTFYRNMITEMSEALYQSKSFPVGDIGIEQYDTCYNLMFVLYSVDKERFLNYCEELSKVCDRMSAHRIETLVKEIVKE